MKVIKAKNYQDISEKACAIISEKLKSIEKPVLGLATGSTPEGLYKQLIKKYNEKELSFQNVTTFNLDEYVGLEKNDANSYHYYMNEKLFNHIDISPNNVHVPNGMAPNLEQECDDYEQLIKDAGKIDLQLLGLGENGHIGFNEPGTPFDRRTHIVELDESTRKANARFFASLEDVPNKAITMGIGTIVESKEILLLVSGSKKADILKEVLSGDITDQVPASILQKHPNVTIIADMEALEKIENL